MFNRGFTAKLRAMPTRFTTAASKAISVRTVNQRKPQVAMSRPKVAQMFKPRVIPSVTAYSKPSVFAEKPFKLNESMVRFHDPRTSKLVNLFSVKTAFQQKPQTPRTFKPILTKYSKPRVDYQSRYNSEQAKSRNLQTRLNKVSATLDSERNTHQKQEAKWAGEKTQFKSSPFYPAHQVSKGMMKRYVKATKVITPSVNVMVSIGATTETASKAGAVLLGILFLGMIIGRVE